MTEFRCLFGREPAPWALQRWISRERYLPWSFGVEGEHGPMLGQDTDRRPDRRLGQRFRRRFTGCPGGARRGVAERRHDRFDGGDPGHLAPAAAKDRSTGTARKVTRNAGAATYRNPVLAGSPPRSPDPAIIPGKDGWVVRVRHERPRYWSPSGNWPSAAPADRSNCRRDRSRPLDGIRRRQLGKTGQCGDRGDPPDRIPTRAAERRERWGRYESRRQPLDVGGTWTFAAPNSPRTGLAGRLSRR